MAFFEPEPLAHLAFTETWLPTYKPNDPRGLAAFPGGQSSPMLRQWTNAPEDSALMLRYRDGDVAGFRDAYINGTTTLCIVICCGFAITATAPRTSIQEVWGKIIKARAELSADGKIHDLPVPRCTQLLYRPYPPQQTTLPHRRCRAGQSARPGRST